MPTFHFLSRLDSDPNSILPLISTCTNVGPAFFYTKAFVYNSVAVYLIMTMLSHCTVEGPQILCQGWMRRTFGDAGG